MAPGKTGKSTGPLEDPSVTLFREYLRIDTVHPKPDYGEDGGGQDGEACGELATQLCSSGLWTWLPESLARAVLIVVLRNKHLCALSLLVSLIGTGMSLHPELPFLPPAPCTGGHPFPQCPDSGTDACSNPV